MSQDKIKKETGVLLTGKQLAEQLGLSHRVIQKWTYSRKISCLKISHRCVRYRLDQVLKDLEDASLVPAMRGKELV